MSGDTGSFFVVAPCLAECSLQTFFWKLLYLIVITRATNTYLNLNFSLSSDNDNAMAVVLLLGVTALDLGLALLLDDFLMGFHHIL